MTITIDNLLQAIIIFQSFLLALFLFFHKKGKRLSHLLLGSVLLVLAWQMLGIFLGNIGIQKTFFESVNCLYGFLYGPLFFLYTNSICKKDFAIKKSDLLHFIPFMVSILGVMFLNTAFCQPRVYIAYVASILIYTLLSFLKIRRYQKVVRNAYSRAEMMRLDWLLWAFILFSIVIAVDIFSFALFMLNIPNTVLDVLIFIVILLFVNTLYFKGLQHAEIFTGFSKDDAELSDQLTVSSKINLSESEIQEIILSLEAFMKTQHPYRNPNLSISELAHQIHIPKRKLSELINAYYHQNFVDFINTFRIEEAKSRLTNPKDEKETILEVMYAVGFNSKSSFNTIFKRKTGLTPSQFRRKNDE